MAGPNALVAGLEERVEFNGFFGHKHSESAEHGSSSVLCFSLVEQLHPFEVSTFHKVQRIKVRDRCDGPWKAAGKLVLIWHPAIAHSHLAPSN